MTAPVSDSAEIDAVLCQVGSAILPLRLLEPTNGEEERRRFAAEPDYNPRFTYAPIGEEVLKLAADRLESIAPDDSPLGRLFEHTRKYLWRRLALCRNLGTDRFWDPELYGLPPEDLIRIAERLIEVRPTERTGEPIHGSDRLQLMCEQALAQYGLDDWRVVTRPHISSTNVESANRLVVLRSDTRYTMTSMKRLIVHEIETHVLRAANGFLQPYRVLGAAVVPGYLATEEGLALINEERAGYVDHDRLRMLAARVIASHLAHLTGFREIYERLRAYGFSEVDSWTTVKRVKRGLGDTRLPGGYVKDHVYLWGKLKLEQYLVDGGDLATLYVGKIGVEMLDLIAKLGLQPPRYLPRTYRR